MNDTILRQALVRAIRSRTCPPVDVLRSQPEKCHGHLAKCTACQEALHNASPVGAQPPQKNTEQPPAPGDICVIAPPIPPTEFFDAGGVYFNPPHVLVLEEDDGSGLVRVAQLFPESALASQGDLGLGHGTDFYAQCWNVYGMYVGHLSSPLRRTRPEFARLVLANSGGPFLPVAVNGPLWHFRQCELSVGSFFALPSVSYALELLEERASAVSFGSSLPAWLDGLAACREVQPCEYAYAASDGAKRFNDRRTRSSVEIKGCAISVESQNARSLGFLFLDASGKPVALHKKGLGTRILATAFSDGAINADSAYLVILGPDERTRLRIAPDVPEIANIRVFPLENGK